MKLTIFLFYEITFFTVILLKLHSSIRVKKLNFKSHRKLKRKFSQSEDGNDDPSSKNNAETTFTKSDTDVKNDPSSENNAETTSMKSDSDKSCFLQKISFSYKNFITFQDFFNAMKGKSTGFSSYDIKEIFRFIDIRNTGSFSSERWSNFVSLFLSTFNQCDTDKNCILDKNELSTCLNRNETSIVTEFTDSYTPSDVIDNIIFSLDYNNVGGINLSQYLLLRKIIIGFRQNHIDGKLDKEMFKYSIKISFNDKMIDDIDLELAFKTSVFLMKEKIVNFQLNFLQYLEICRIVNSFYSFDVSISEGWITRQEIYNGYEYSRFPSKIYKSMFDGYFQLFEEDHKLNENKLEANYDQLSMQFETFAFIEFWGNIYGNYSLNFRMNQTGFIDISQNQYFPSQFKNYLNKTNFEDSSQINVTFFPEIKKLNDKDFLLSFIQKSFKTSIKKNSESKIKTENKFKYRSLFELKDDEDENSSESSDSQNSTNNINNSLTNIFKILDIFDSGFITFDLYFTFYKYLRTFDILHNANENKDSIISSNKLSDVNQIIVIPPLSVSEKMRLAAFDSISCDYVDFLLFFDYLISPRSFKPFLIDNERNFVNELNLKLVMRKMNLFTDLDSKNLVYTSGIMLSNYDYENVLKNGITNKCISNEKIYSKIQESLEAAKINDDDSKNDDDDSKNDDNDSKNDDDRSKNDDDDSKNDDNDSKNDDDDSKNDDDTSEKDDDDSKNYDDTSEKDDDDDSKSNDDTSKNDVDDSKSNNDTSKNDENSSNNKDGTLKSKDESSNSKDTNKKDDSSNGKDDISTLPPSGSPNKIKKLKKLK